MIFTNRVLYFACQNEGDPNTFFVQPRQLEYPILAYPKQLCFGDLLIDCLHNQLINGSHNDLFLAESGEDKYGKPILSIGKIKTESKLRLKLLGYQAFFTTRGDENKPQIAQGRILIPANQMTHVYYSFDASKIDIAKVMSREMSGEKCPELGIEANRHWGGAIVELRKNHRFLLCLSDGSYEGYFFTGRKIQGLEEYQLAKLIRAKENGKLREI